MTKFHHRLVVVHSFIVFILNILSVSLSTVGSVRGAGTGFPVNIQYMNITGQAFEFSTDQTGSREENIPKLMKITDSE